MRMTDRDQAMLDWLGTVRVADMDALRWALGGLNGASEPVSLRRAQQWVARLAEEGLVDSARPTFRDGSIVWATHLVAGRSRPHLFRQTTRHEVSVAGASARFLAAGYTWSRDRKPVQISDHQTDGVARREGLTELVEVELTPKYKNRYQSIFQNHAKRMNPSEGNVTRVLYLCDELTGRRIPEEAVKWMMPDKLAKITVAVVFDTSGRWINDRPDLWTAATIAPMPTMQPQLIDSPNW